MSAALENTLNRAAAAVAAETADQPNQPAVLAERPVAAEAANNSNGKTIGKTAVVALAILAVGIAICIAYPHQVSNLLNKAHTLVTNDLHSIGNTLNTFGGTLKNQVFSTKNCLEGALAITSTATAILGVKYDRKNKEVATLRNDPLQDARLLQRDRAIARLEATLATTRRPAADEVAE